jgi:hypothetical protein
MAKGMICNAGNGVCGPRIETVQLLWALGLTRKSVICPNTNCFHKPQPAAWMINLQGRVLVRLFASGMYVYKPDNKRK